jgi:hypothetical protein
MENKKFKKQGYENCSTQHKLILTHFGENFNFFIILPFIETVFHILNRKLPQGTKVWPPDSLHINPFDYLKCGVSRRGINRSSHTKKQSLITTIMEVSSNIPREATKRACSPFRSRLEKVFAAKGDFIR